MCFFFRDHFFLSYDYVSADLNCPREAIMRPWPEMGRQQHNSCCLCIFSVSLRVTTWLPDVALVWFILDHPRNHFLWSRSYLIVRAFGRILSLSSCPNWAFRWCRVRSCYAWLAARPTRMVSPASVLLISHRKVYILDMIYCKTFCAVLRARFTALRFKDRLFLCRVVGFPPFLLD